MSAGNDEVDAALAKQLAWRLSAEPPPARPAPTLPADPESVRDPSFDADAFIEQFDAAVESAWAAPLGEQQTRYLKLVASFGRQRRLIGRLPPSPSSLRFARLHVRHHAAFVPGSDTDWAELLAFVELPTGPETLEFLVDAVECPDPYLVDGLDVGFGLVDWATLFPALARRLGPLLPGLAPTPRHHALHMLCLGSWPEAKEHVAAAFLSRSLTERILAATHDERHRALDASLVLQAVRDVIEYPPPLDTNRRVTRAYVYEHHLARLCVAHPSPELRSTLEDVFPALNWPLRLDWAAVPNRLALKALLRIAPEAVLPRLDALLTNRLADDRMTGVLALDWLDDRRALPRLLRAAHDHSGLVASAARDKLQERFPDADPGARRLGAFDVLVDDSERHRALAWLRLVDDVGDENEAHLMMLASKAPDPAALAVFCVVQAAGYDGPGSPTEEAIARTWVAIICNTWPATLAARALLELARGGPEKWREALAAHLATNAPRDVRRAVVDEARRWLHHFDPSRRITALLVLPLDTVKPADLEDFFSRPVTVDADDVRARFESSKRLAPVLTAIAEQRIARAIARHPPDLPAAIEAFGLLPVLKRSSQLALRDALSASVDAQLASATTPSASEDLLFHFLIGSKAGPRDRWEAADRWMSTAPLATAAALADEMGLDSQALGKRARPLFEAFLAQGEASGITASDVVAIAGPLRRAYAFGGGTRDVLAEAAPRIPWPLRVRFILDLLEESWIWDDYDGAPAEERFGADLMRDLLAYPRLGRVEAWRRQVGLLVRSGPGRKYFLERLPTVACPSARVQLHDALGLPPVPDPEWRDDPRMPGEGPWADDEGSPDAAPAAAPEPDTGAR